MLALCYMVLCVPSRPVTAQPFANGVVVVSDDASTTAAIHAADVDGDGDVDLIGGGSDGVVWFENDGAASPEFTRHPISSEGAADVFAADLDGDGDTDVLADYTWYKNDGGATPSFSSYSITPAPQSTGVPNLSVADVDLDGDGDVLIANDYAGGDRYQRIAWYENSGGNNPAFGEHVIESGSSTYTGKARAADIDGDGDNDIVSAGLWYENTTPSNPTFTPREQEQGGEGVGDLDGDDDNDVVQFGLYDLSWVENIGGPEPLSGGFSNTYDIQDNDTPHYFRGHLADIDGDGDIDIATANDDGEFAWYENDGSTAPSFNMRRITTPAWVGDDIHAADLNGDGTLDWLSSGSEVTWFENRADIDAPVPPVGFNTTARSGSVDLSWTASSSSDVVAYRVYRSTSAIDSTGGPGGLTPLAEVSASATSYTDASVEPGQYYYRLTAVDGAGNESDFSAEATATVEDEPSTDPASPMSVQPDVRFGNGDPSDAGNYRLIALPGSVDIDVASLFGGQAGESGDWRVFREAGGDGSNTSVLQECDVDQTCRFAPGEGYWALSGAPWQPSITVDPVPLSSAGTYSVRVHDGWNIISNPFAVPIDWSVVQAETGTDLGVLYAYDGAWRTVQSMNTAISGEAYYFKNDAGISAIALPHPSAKRSIAQGTKDTGKGGPARLPVARLQIEAMHEGQPRSRITLGVRPPGMRGGNRNYVEAPPSLFARIRIRAAASPSSGRYTLLERYMPLSGEGTTFHVQLHAPSTHAVPLRIQGLDTFNTANVLLVERATGVVHSLKDGAARRAESVVTVRPHPRGEANRQLLVLAGSDSYVEQELTTWLPDRPVLEQGHPNPASEAVTIEYVLPRRQHVELALFDVLGRRIRTLVNETQEAGRRSVYLRVGRLPSGVYFYRLRANGALESRKLTIVR